jgi:hypothetical protein
VGLGLLVFALGCASTPPPPPPATPEPEEVDAAAVKEEDPAPMNTVSAADAPERQRPASTATYDQAMAVPEPVDIEDDHSHLTDAQLTGPMRSATNGCKIPGNTHLTIHTAVQNGRAIGVTVDVRVDPPKSTSKKPPKPKTATQLKAEKKAKEKLVSCVDKNVRVIVWPPNRRRDSFTTEL